MYRQTVPMKKVETRTGANTVWSASTFLVTMVSVTFGSSRSRKAYHTCSTGPSATPNTAMRPAHSKAFIKLDTGMPNNVELDYYYVLEDI